MKPSVETVDDRFMLHLAQTYSDDDIHFLLNEPSGLAQEMWLWALEHRVLSSLGRIDRRVERLTREEVHAYRAYQP